MVREYGDFVQFRVGVHRIIQLNDPEAIGAVLTSHYSAFRKGRGVERRYGFLGTGLLISEGEHHKKQRADTRPAFRHEELTGFADEMARAAEATVSAWDESRSVDVLTEMRKITLAVIGRTLFKNDFHSQHREIIQALQLSLEQFRAFNLPVPRVVEWLRFAANRRTQESKKRLLAPMRHALATGDPNHRNDVFALLMRDEHGVRTDIDAVLNEALTIFLAGYETSAVAVTWALELLSRHPEIARRVEQEVDSVLGDRPPRQDDVPRLKYTRMVFDESMRIYPPVWRLMRRAIKDFDIDGITIPAGSYVILSQWLMHHDSRYFPEPQRFDPERWTPERRAERPPFSYFPFGGSVRRCIGEAFGIQESVLTLATVIRRWRLSPTTARPVGVKPLHFLQPEHPIMLRVEARAGVRLREFEAQEVSVT
jgi:cytochrome P450